MAVNELVSSVVLGCRLCAAVKGAVLAINTSSLAAHGFRMARKLRAKYAGAIYDVTNRSDRWARFNPNSEIGAGCRPAIRGAYAAGVRFSAVRRKPRFTEFLSPKRDKERETMVWAGRPNQHASHVRSPILTSEFGLTSSFRTGLALPSSAWTLQDTLPVRNWSSRVRGHRATGVPTST